MIEIKGLTKYYDSFCAVDHMDLNIDRGEVVGLLGPNGAGKTTTLRMLTGFFKPSEGVVKIDGLHVGEYPLAVKKLIGYLPESAPLYHDMLVFDYLNYIAKIRQIPKDEIDPRIVELSKLCGLGHIMHNAIGELSKGLKQRVGLAHAMIGDPQILILDEPTSGLDPNQIVEIREIIRRIGKEKTVILSTHILSEAEATCDRVVIINQGKIVADGSTDSLKKSGANELNVHVAIENGSASEIKNKLGNIPGVKFLEIEAFSGCLQGIISCESRPDMMKDIYLCIRETNWILTKFYRETKTLENIFRELTGDKLK